MKLITQNIMNVLSNKYGELRIDDVVSSIEGKRNAPYKVDEIINTLKDADFNGNITPEKVVRVLKSKTITSTKVVDAIARTTYLTREDVKTCFAGLEDFIMSYCNSNYNSEYITITIPYVGKISTKKRKGRKAGVYKISEKIGDGLVDFIQEEDEPDYLRLSFELKPSFQNALRESGLKRDL